MNDDSSRLGLDSEQSRVDGMMMKKELLTDRPCYIDDFPLGPSVYKQRQN